MTAMRGSMRLRTLRREDLDALYDFEMENRAWFERTIATRGDAFYTRDGVAENIAICLDGLARGTFHPCVMVDESDAILGRANLRDMDLARRVAMVGYRVAERHAGRGLASAAVRQLQALAVTRWRLERLAAHVTVRNPASARVLEKSGFVRDRFIEAMATLGGETVAGYEYLCDLAGHGGGAGPGAV